MARLVRSTSARLSLRFAGLYAIVTALVFVLTYAFADREITDWVSEQLVKDGAGFVALYDNDGLEAVQAKLDGFAGFNFENYRIYLLQDASGAVITGNIIGIDRPASGDYVPSEAIQLGYAHHDKGIGYLLHEVTLGPYRLTLGTSTYFLEELSEVLVRGFAIGFVLLLLAGLTAGIAVGRKTERRLVAISGALKSVATGALEARVPVSGSDGDDLARLAAEINRTIVQLQKMVDAQTQISADIAHDLRTPMQRLRQRLETMLQSGHLPAQIETDVQAATDIADDLIETFHSLLRIAQIEAGQRANGFAQIALATVLARIEDAYGAVAEENGQMLEFVVQDKAASVLGDQHLLIQMIANIVENALRHNAAGTRIKVTLSRSQDRPVIEVADNGPGIPEDEREKVLRRFYRLEKSRTTSGNGLGLSMVKAICDLHEAELELHDNAPGLAVRVRFP
ncbi:HAMP domain-containing histidine kinase [Rhodobacteraceae bacterium]|nr:HAMP domain-containing histidine kinase [Paracoccaceae bacterium]